MGQLTPALGLEMGYIYFCLPISGALMIFVRRIYHERVKQLMSGWRFDHRLTTWLIEGFHNGMASNTDLIR